MSRVQRLFLVLWGVVYLLGIYKTYNEAVTYISKEKVISHHVVGVTLPILTAVDNKEQLAAVIAHELSHIQLGHTLGGKHHISMEYNADLMSFYYLKKAGYGVCGAKQYWEKNKGEYLLLTPTSHPNHQTRAYYMDMPECKNKKVVKEKVTLEDAKEIFNKLNKHVIGRNRYRTQFELYIFTTEPNAYAYTQMKEK
jgi:hypothetical protein